MRDPKVTCAKRFTVHHISSTTQRWWSHCSFVHDLVLCSKKLTWNMSPPLVFIPLLLGFRKGEGCQHIWLLMSTIHRLTIIFIHPTSYLEKHSREASRLPRSHESHGSHPALPPLPGVITGKLYKKKKPTSSTTMSAFLPYGNIQLKQPQDTT